MVDIASALLRHQRLGLDTSVFIYQIEEVAPFDAPARQVIQHIGDGFVTGVTSVLTVSDLLVKPLQSGRRGLATRYEILVRAIPNLAIAEVDSEIARHAAVLRANYRLGTVDAVQIATAIEFGATAFVTNDRRLRRVKDLEIVLLENILET